MSEAHPTGTLWDLTLAEFRDRTASANPTPGGGSVAAVGAALGAGLVVMALEVTRRKVEDPGDLDEIDGMTARLRGSLEALSRGADEDVAAFDAFMAALRMPKDDDVQKAARRSAMTGAAVAATESPLAAARDAVDALDVSVRAAAVAGTNIISDVAAGVHLLEAGALAVLLNVDVNLRSIKDADAAAAYAASRDELAGAARANADAARAVIAERLRG